MEKPQVRIIQSQSEEVKVISIDQNEAESLLRKYGHTIKDPEIVISPQADNNLTFEEMLEIEKRKKESSNINSFKKDIGPKPITFDGEYNSNVKYQQDGDSGYTFKVEITTNMKL